MTLGEIIDKYGFVDVTYKTTVTNQAREFSLVREVAPDLLEAKFNDGTTRYLLKNGLSDYEVKNEEAKA